MLELMELHLIGNGNVNLLDIFLLLHWLAVCARRFASQLASHFTLS